MYFVYEDKIYEWQLKEKTNNWYKFYKPNWYWYQDYITVKELFVWETVEELKNKLIKRVWSLALQHKK